MAEEAQIVNRIVVQGIDEAKAQVQSLKQLLNETRISYEQARRSVDQTGMFKGDKVSADELLKSVNGVQLQINKLNSEMSQGYASMSGTQASYAKQMSSMNASIEQQFQLFRQGSIGQAEYAMSLDKYTKGMSVAKAEQEAFSKSIGTYTGQWERMRARVESHASWIVAGGLIGAAIAIPGAALDSIVRMDTAMAGMNQVMDHTHTAANAASKGISEQAEQQNMLNAESQKFLTIAAQYGESVDNIVEAGKLWGRLYKDINVVNTLTAQSAKLAVADNFSLADANKAVESAMFQFGLTARNTSEALAYSGNVIDVWTKLAHNAGASAQDISQGVERAGSAAHQTGADFEFLSAQVATGVRATGRSGAEIGNMLKSLYGSFHSDKAIAELDKLGISVYKIGEDGTKQFRKAQDVMLDLSVTAQGTNQSLEETYKQLAGGKFQWSKAGATLGDYKEFIRTWGEAVNSMGFTDKQVGMQLDTISRRMQTLKTDVQSLAVSGGQAGIAGALKDSISAVDNFVMGLKQIPAWSIEAAGGLAVAAKAFVVLKNAIVATNVASLASRATPLGAALTVLGIAAVAATEAMGGLANEQRNAARAAQDQISVAQQQQQQLEKQSEFADALMGAHQKLEAQLANSTEGTAQYNKAIENQQETEKQLTSVLGEAAVQRIKDANWSIDAYNQEKQAFEDGVSAKKKALQQMVDARVIELETERDVIKTSIENYWKDAENFKGSLELKAKYLGWWKAIQMEYSEWKIGNAESGISDLKSQIDEIDQQLSEGGNEEVLNRRKEILQGQLEQEQASLQSQQDAYQKSIAGGTAELQQQKSDLDQQIISLKQQSLNLAEIPGGLKIATEKEGKTKGQKAAPADTSEQIQKKLDNYNVKSIEDQAAIAQNNYKSRLDAITDATNRYGKSYAFLDATTGTMNQHVKDLQNTTAALSEQLQSDLQKINDLASETGATISMSGANDGSAEGTAWNYFTSKGYSPEAAAGIIGNLMTESGIQTGVWAGDNSGSYGIGQWKDGRLEGLKDFASSLGTSIDDLNTQLAYVDYELKNNESNAYRKIASATTPESAAYAVSKYYERPAWAENPERQQNAADVYNRFLGSSQQVSVSLPQEALMSAGITQQAWQGMSVESKKQFIQDNKEQIKDANLLVGYLTQISGEQKKIAEYQKQITSETKATYEATVKGIQDIESYQVKQAELSSRASLAAIGYYATDSDKAIAAQKLTQEKLAASNAALAYANSKGIDVMTDPTMAEERVKNLELRQQLQQEQTFATPEAAYKQRLAEIEYNQKMSQYGLSGDLTSPYNAQAKFISNLEAAQEKVKALEKLLSDMKANDPFADQTENFKKYNLELQEAKKNAQELADTYSTKMRQGVYDVTNELLLQGKKIGDIWGDLWKQLANDALKALLRIKNDSPGLLAQALGIFGGAKGGTQGSSSGSSFDYSGLLSSTANAWGTKSSYKSQASDYDTSKWNQYGNLLGSLMVDKGTSGGYSGSTQQSSSFKPQQQSSGGTAWGSILGSLVGLFHASGGVVDSPAIAGEDGEEVIIPVEKNKGNSANLLSYAANKLGQKSSGVTADFSSKDIAKTAMNVSVSSATNMVKTNGILATQNQILTTMLNQMGQQQGQQTVIVNAGGNSPSMEDQASAYNTLRSRRYINS